MMKFMSVSMTISIQGLEYRELNDEIKRTMRRSARDVVRLGFMLRQMMEKALWAEDYSCFDDYLAEELHLDYSMATRFMNINRKYSVSGNSMEVAEEYEGYSQGLLIEMLNMPQELEEKVSPDMTVRQVREVKRRAKAKREVDDNIPGQTSFEKVFPECIPEPGISTNEDSNSGNVIDGEYRELKEPGEEKVATSQPEESRAHDESWFVEQYVSVMHDEAVDLFETCRGEQNNSDRAKAIQKRIAPYGYSSRSCSEYDFTFHGFSGGIDFRIGSEEMHLKYARFAVELMKLLKKALDSRQRRYLDGFARHFISCEYDWLLEDFQNRVSDVTRSPEEIKKSCKSYWEFKTDKGIAHVDMFDNCITLLDENNDLIGCFDWFYLAAAIQRMWNTVVLEKAKAEPVMTQPEEEAVESASEPEEVTQPELPALKNNDQRKEWLNNYKAWGLWYRDENIDVNYYKYDFTDGSRLIVAEYPQRHSYYSGEYQDERYYHLLEKNKKGFKKPYDEQYRQQTDSETYLVDFLKNLQKKK